MSLKITSILIFQKRAGFTLIELLIVISVISVISVVAVSLFGTLKSSANDAQLMANVDAMSKAYEANYDYNIGQYQLLTSNQFASKAIPSGNYYNDFQGNKGYRVCIAIKGGTDPCTSSSDTCYCKESEQIKYTSSAGSSPQPSASVIIPSPSPSIAPSPVPSPSPSPADPSPLPSPVISPSPVPSVPVSDGLTHPASCDPGQTLDDGLAGYWTFNETSGTTAADNTGNSPGTLVNATFGSGYTNSTTMNFGNAVYIANGSTPTNYVNFGNTSAVNNMAPMTVSLWINAELTTGATMLYSRSVNSTSTLQFEFYKSSSSAVFRISNGTSIIAKTYSSFFNTASTWFYLTGVFDGNNIYVYKNGVASTPTAFTGSQVSSSNSTVVGARSNASQPNASGLVKIDDLRVYNRALSAAEISAIYNNGQGCLP